MNRRLCLNEDKFICGNDITIYDIVVGGFFYNIVLNPNAACAEGWKKAMDDHSTERINKYLNDFG